MPCEKAAASHTDLPVSAAQLLAAGGVAPNGAKVTTPLDVDWSIN